MYGKQLWKSAFQVKNHKSYCRICWLCYSQRNRLIEVSKKKSWWIIRNFDWNIAWVIQKQLCIYSKGLKSYFIMTLQSNFLLPDVTRGRCLIDSCRYIREKGRYFGQIIVNCVGFISLHLMNMDHFPRDRLQIVLLILSEF